MAATTQFQAEKCRHLVSEHEASAQYLSSRVHQFLIYSTFELVYNIPNTFISTDTHFEARNIIT